MNVKELARIGAQARLSLLMREVRALVKMFPGIADEDAGLKPRPTDGRRKKKTRRSYDAKYKANAVESAKKDGVPATAKALGIAPTVIRSWMKKK